ncbi:arginine-tRNA-protein transferase [Fluviicoccus keumensis]|uniref:Aspartate/glutamate leucyltransferase n=1 Tax=Fluviicoccus keumensis TaxID=1435465 RepID=A0A4Q7Z4L1_9GAMM|nr:arginyltransferase [Fluviicoccus keumensis]RZU45290.1 arginine-tRNA-protein transferase [Fluviicoccus keumensis]
MTASSGIKFFSTPPHACSYLDDRKAITLFADPQAPMNSTLYGQLSLYGFRRSGNYIYRPQCQDCQACIPVRIPVDAFEPNRQQRKTRMRNADVEITSVNANFVQEHYDLYAKYIHIRHADGDMFPPSIAQYVSFLFSDWCNTRLVEFRHDGKLLAVAVCDFLRNGLSAVYTFYDPEEEKRSLGTLAVLWQIGEAIRLGLPYVYLGYWVQESPKMAYKTRFQPLEAFMYQRWQELPPDA